MGGQPGHMGWQSRRGVSVSVAGAVGKRQPLWGGFDP